MSSSCTPQMLEMLADSTTNSFYSWLGQKQDEFNSLGGLPTLTEAQVSELEALNSEIRTTLECFNEQNSSITTINTDNALVRSNIVEKKKELLRREDDIHISKDRVKLVSRPELSRSYYDGWFPLNRPMHDLSVPLLIGGGAFFLSLSIFLMLSLININTVFTVFVPEIGRGSSSFAKPFILMTAVSIVLLILTIYAFTR
jgi:hypothetical protein